MTAGQSHIPDLFLFSKTRGPVLRVIQPPFQWSPEVKKKLRREANHLPSSNARVKKHVETYFALPYVFTAWGLFEHGDFTFIFSSIKTNV
jgi:hypothetical protein